MNLSLYLAMLIVVHVETTSCNAWVIGGRQKLKLCLDDEQSVARWKVEVFPDGSHLYLYRGWKHFAHALDLQDGFSLALWYGGRS